MIGMNRTVNCSVNKLLRLNNKTERQLAEYLGIGQKDLSNMLNGVKMVNSEVLQQIADYFHVPVKRLMEASEAAEPGDVIKTIMTQVKSPVARRSLKFADELADMVIFYARVREGAEELEEVWEA
ncbi:MAG: helix-turn-helix transcriptional regulator [Clostridia bacterium]|nr:helix-turn-helix transcriptional regulator [Clostridia bacterium]